ncbi:hypothetical protein AB6A40_000075 [Gnathostoma spinigerum]|uniref:UBC core domain-containing protein n=1 Tax=Gnathostoma spinigerum TaxID=75299 RepID=A0ABD6E3C4_9BILA
MWRILLIPPRPPYDAGAFKLQVNFPPEYPFKPPSLTLNTPIYHPNIDQKGNICLPILQYDNWKQAATITNVLQAFIFMLCNPEPDRSLRHEIANEFIVNKEKFMKQAEEFTRKNAEKLP